MYYIHDNVSKMLHICYMSDKIVNKSFIGGNGIAGVILLSKQQLQIQAG